MTMDLEVRDTKHLGDILGALRAQSFVSRVERLTSTPAPAPELGDGGQPKLPLGGTVARKPATAGGVGS
jgi:hypothetical protein